MKIDVPLQLRYGGIVLLFLGPVLALLATGLFFQARQTQNWPTVNASVVQSKVEVSKKAGGLRRGQAFFQNYYTAAIQYEFVVNGERFTGYRIAFDASRSSGFDRDDAERWVRKYPVGTAITIHYSPQNPKQSVIDPSPDTVLLAVVFGFGVLAIPAGLVLRRVARQMQPVEALDATVPLPGVLPVPSHPVASVPPPAVVPADHQELKQDGLGDVKPTRWLIRTMAIVTGLVFCFFGGLALYVNVKLFLRAGDEPGHGAISVAVHLGMIGIMGGITLLGIFLFWKGIKSRGRPRQLKD